MTAPRTRRPPRPRAAAARAARRGPRPDRVVVLVLGLVAVLAAAWLAVVGRRAVTAATPVSAGSPTAPTDVAEATVAAEAGPHAEPAAPDADAGPDAGPDARPDARPEKGQDTGPDAVRDVAAVAELSRVSGLGRRSAEALVAGGVTSLTDLAGRSDEELGAVLDAAGVRRSATLATWPSQARRLLAG